MMVKSIWIRRVHKWIGLVIAIQFVMWTVSGAAMALLSMNEVAGGKRAELAAPTPLTGGQAWQEIQQSLSGQPIVGLSLRMAGPRQVLDVTTTSGTRLFDAGSGAPLVIDRAAATAIAGAAHPTRAPIMRTAPLRKIELAVREHELPIWRVDFRDESNSSYYVSGTTGAVLERRNDTWRWWDFFWMLHNMDYADRTSFNHPLIITAGSAMVWLALTGFWLLFRTMWRHDFAAIRQRVVRPAPSTFGKG